MEQTCGLDVALQYIGGKWKPILLFHLYLAPRRFGELKRLVEGISEKVLIQQLRDLTDHGIITRHDFKEVPPKVEYTVTDFGRTLARATTFMRLGQYQSSRIYKHLDEQVMAQAFSLYFHGV